MRSLAFMFFGVLGACASPSVTGVRQLEVSGPVELHVTFTAAGPAVLPEGLAPDLDGHVLVEATSARLVELSLPGTVEVVVRAGAHVNVKAASSSSLTLRAPGGAIDGHVDVDSLRVDGTAGGLVSLDGRTRVLELSGEALSFDGAQLSSEVVRVDLGGEGRSRVRVQQQATGAVRGGVLQVVGPGRVEVASRGGAIEHVAPESVSVGQR